MSEVFRARKDLRRLKVLVAEAKDRGINLPPEIYEQLSGKKVIQEFLKNEAGYYIGRDGRQFNANPKQQIFLASTARFVAMLAGRGAGKSSSGAQKSLMKIESGQPGAIMNPDFENFKISTWPEFREWVDWKTVIKKHQHRGNPDWTPSQPFTLAFKNGAWVICKGLKSPDSARGPNINWLWFDEPGRGDPLGQDWQIANAAVRIGRQPQAWATGTPNGKDHWLYSFFIQQEIAQEVIDEFRKVSADRELIETIFTSIEDNKDNLDPLYYASMLAAYPEGWLRRQELFGEFVDRGGVLGHREWFDGQVVYVIPEEVKLTVRFWDLAATEKKIVSGKKLNDPDETVGTRMSWNGQKNFYIEDQIAGFWEWKTIKQRIIETAIMDGPHVRIVLEEEPGSGGINQVAEIAEVVRSALPAWQTPIGKRPEGDKVTRANIWFAEAATKNIFMVNGSWNGGFLDQLSSFPVGRHDDRIDSVSGARMSLAPIVSWKKIEFISL